MGILVGVNSDHFEEGNTNEHLVAIIHEEEYCTIIGEKAWTYNPPININAYNPTVFNETVSV